MTKTIKTINDYETLSFNKDFAFRGQFDNKLKLLPGAYRDSNPKYQGPKDEIYYLYKFIHSLRQNGFSDYMAGLLEHDILIKPFNIFPEEDMLSYLALAQHYAFDSEFPWLKTSLLDITFNIDIATYFSVRESLDDGIVYVFDLSKIKENTSYGIYAPTINNELMARMAVQKGAHLYRIQTYEGSGEAIRYQNSAPFDEIVEEKLIIPMSLKANLKEYLHRKLFDYLLFPRLILRQKIPDMSYSGKIEIDDLWRLKKPEIERCMSSGDRHSEY